MRVFSVSAEFNSLWPHGLYLQGIFFTQGSNTCLLKLLHWQVHSFPQSHQQSPWQTLFSRILETKWITLTKVIIEGLTYYLCRYPKICSLDLLSKWEFCCSKSNQIVRLWGILLENNFSKIIPFMIKVQKVGPLTGPNLLSRKIIDPILQGLLKVSINLENTKFCLCFQIWVYEGILFHSLLYLQHLEQCLELSTHQ